MNTYRIVFSKTAVKDLKDLPNDQLKKIYEKIKSLENDARPTGCKKLAGTKEDLWRVRVGDYRIIYAIDDVIRIIDIRRIGRRRDVYDKK
jgi:mRNA interferase RelE/StbE